jgi:AraC-like DNA-binding protein
MISNAAEFNPERRPRNLIRLRVGTHSVVLQYPSAHETPDRTHPAWEIVVPEAGLVHWSSRDGRVQHTPGVIFPPQVAHRAGSDQGHVSLRIDPWCLGLGPGNRTPIAVDADTMKHLRALVISDDQEPDDLARETVALLRRRGLLPGAIRIDPRVTTAVRQLAGVNRLEQAAATVGLSSSRLRALLHEQTGTPPAGLRSWQRLRIAIHDLPVKPIALAAVDAGFADQAHLTRTANRLVGQTPGEIMRGLRNAAPERGHHRFDQGHDAMGRSNRRMSAVRQSKDYGVGHAA